MKLSNEEIQELIIEYQSKVRKAEFQLVEYKQTLASLEKSLLKPRSKRSLGTKAAATTVTNTSAKTTARKRSTTTRRRKPAAKATTTAAASTGAKRRGRPAKKATTAKATPAAKKTAASSSATTSTGKKRATRKRTAAKSTAAKTTATKSTAKKTTRRSAAKKATTKAAAAKPKRRGRPAKKATTGATTKTAPKKTRTASRSTGKKGGYRLNEWDELVLATLNDRQKVSVFSDFHEKATAKAKSEGRSVDDKTLYSRINQSLHKLANKRDVLVKVPHKGRGYAYGLKEWKSPSGKGVQKKYQ